MLRKDVAVVLRSARSGETSLLATVLGRESGKINLVGKGAFTSRSPFAGALEVGNLIEAVYYHKEGRTLFFLKEVHVRATLGAVRESLPHLASALGLLELVEHVCYWGSPEARIVDMLAEFLECPPAKDPLHAYLAFAFDLAEILGVQPDLSRCAACGGEAAYYHPAEGTSLCRAHSGEAPHRVRLSPALLAYVAATSESTLAGAAAAEVDPVLRKRFGEIIHWTYTFHIQGYSLPKALQLLPRGNQQRPQK
jgi:DNA repair protein RecO (recombination protein O)